MVLWKTAKERIPELYGVIKKIIEELK